MAVTALRALSTNAVTPIRAMLHTQEAPYEKLLIQNARSIPPAARRYLFQKLKPGQSAVARTAAAHALAVLGPAANAAVPDLAGALTDPSAEVRWAAAQALGRIGQDSIPTLRTAVTNRDPNLRHLAVYGLGVAGTNAAGAAGEIFERMLDPDPAIHDAAVYALSRVGTNAVPVILEQFASGDPARREAAARVVRYLNIPPRQILRKLIEFATNNSPELRQHAFQALRALGLEHPLAAATCLRGVNDESPDVRTAALLALSPTTNWMTDSTFSRITMRDLGQSGSLSNHVATTLEALRGDSNPAVSAAAEQVWERVRALTPP
jgi:HEAT repeat protein